MRTKENMLFERWRASLPDAEQAVFVADGAVDAEAYDKSPHKILLLLKEVSYREGGGWRLREFLRDDGGWPATWDTVTTTFRNGDARRGASTTSNMRTENMSSTIPAPKRVSPQI